MQSWKLCCVCNSVHWTKEQRHLQCLRSTKWSALCFCFCFKSLCETWDPDYLKHSKQIFWKHLKFSAIVWEILLLINNNNKTNTKSVGKYLQTWKTVARNSHWFLFYLNIALSERVIATRQCSSSTSNNSFTGFL